MGAARSKVEVAHAGRPRGRVFCPSSDAGNSGLGISGVLPAGPRRAASRHNSSGQGSRIMIKSDAQRERTVAQIEGFRRALAKVAQEKPGRRSAAICGSYEGMIRQLEDELREYDQLKSGELKLPHIERL